MKSDSWLFSGGFYTSVANDNIELGKEPVARLQFVSGGGGCNVVPVQWKTEKR